jgi:hypothetical protein
LICHRKDVESPVEFIFKAPILCSSERRLDNQKRAFFKIYQLHPGNSFKARDWTGTGKRDINVDT